MILFTFNQKKSRFYNLSNIHLSGVQYLYIYIYIHANYFQLQLTYINSVVVLFRLINIPSINLLAHLLAFLHPR